MDDAERAWLREKLYEHAADLGAQKAQQRALGDDLSAIRTEVRDGLAGIRRDMESHRRDMESHYSHMRGEIVSLRDEERRHADDLIDRLEQSSSRSQGLNRALLFGLGVLIVFGQQVVEHLPRILELLAP